MLKSELMNYTNYNKNFTLETLQTNPTCTNMIYGRRASLQVKKLITCCRFRVELLSIYQLYKKNQKNKFAYL